MKISYECSALIEELEEDIDIYGQNVECYAYFKKLEGYIGLIAIFIAYVIFKNYPNFSNTFSKIFNYIMGWILKPFMS